MDTSAEYMAGDPDYSKISSTLLSKWVVKTKESQYNHLYLLAIEILSSWSNSELDPIDSVLHTMTAQSIIVSQSLRNNSNPKLKETVSLLVLKLVSCYLDQFKHLYLLQRNFLTAAPYALCICFSCQKLYQHNQYMPKFDSC